MPRSKGHLACRPWDIMISMTINITIKLIMINIMINNDYYYHYYYLMLLYYDNNCNK